MNSSLLKLTYIMFAAVYAVVSCKKDNGSPNVGPGSGETVSMTVTLPEGSVWAAGAKVNINGLLSLALAETDAGAESSAFLLPARIKAPFFAAWPENAITAFSGESARMTIPVSQKAGAEPSGFMLGKGNSSSLSLSQALCFVTISSPENPALRRLKFGSAGGKKIAGAFTTDYSSLTPASVGASDYVEITTESDSFNLPITLEIAPDDYTADGFRVVATNTAGEVVEMPVMPAQVYEAGGTYYFTVNEENPSGALNVRFDDPDRRWAAGDIVSINGIASDPLPAESAGGNAAEYEIKDIEAPYCVAFPADAISGYNEGKAYVSIPVEQIIDSPDGSFLLGRADDPEVILSPGTCTLQIKAEAEAEMSLLTLTSIDGKSLAGEFSTNFWLLYPVAGGSSDSIVLTAEGNSAFTLPVSAVIAPGDYSSEGFKIVFAKDGEEPEEYTVKPEGAFVAGGVYTLDINNIPPPPVPVYEISASLLDKSSSTLIFSWTLGGSAAEDVELPYTASLYSDASCTQLVKSYDFAAGAAYWRSKSPKFVFSGLSQNTKYYFQVASGDMISNVLEVDTDAFNIVTMPSEISGTGVVLAEDFGIFTCDFDYPTGAAGLSVDGSSYIKYSESVGSYPMFEWSGFAASRLNKWARDVGSDKRVNMHPGYLTLGSTGKDKGWIVTPPFSVESGKTATATVTLTVCKAFSGANSIYAFGVLDDSSHSGAEGGGANMQDENTTDFSWPNNRPDNIYRKFTVESDAEWVTLVFEGISIQKNDRIVIGCAPQSSDGTTYKNESGKRPGLNVSDIKVEITSL